MPKIVVSGFGGEMPKVSPALLPTHGAQDASNTDITRGTLKPWRKATSVYDAVLSGTIGTIYRYLKGDGSERWLEWFKDVDVQPGPIAGDTTKRAYFTGNGYPRVFDDSLVDTAMSPDTGTAQSGSSNTLTLAATTLADDNDYSTISLTSGPGSVQERNVTAYDSSTKIATVSPRWRTNLILRSEELDNAVWVKSGATVTANSVAGPDGVMTADKLVEDTSSGLHAVAQQHSLGSATFVHSVKAKAGERSIFTMLCRDMSVSKHRSVHFDLSAGTATVGSNDLVGSESIESLGNGWYRCSVIATYEGTNSNSYFDFRMSDGAPGSAGDNYVGDGISGMYFRDAQLEKATELGDYIQTIGAAVTLPDNTTAYEATYINKYPKSSYILGVSAPTTAPTVALGSGGSGTARDLVYVYTFVRKWASGKVDEGMPSPASAKVTALPGQTVAVSDFSATPAGRGVTHIRIYRAGTGDYLYVTEIAVGTTSYNDSALDAALGDALVSAEWSEPPTDMKGLIMLPNGVAAGFSKNEVCFSVPYQVHAYPTRYRYALPYEIVGIGYVGTMVVVATKGYPYLLDGIDPGSVTQMQSPAMYPCLAKRGVVSTESGVLFPTHDGMAIATPGGGVSLITKNDLSREEWENYYAETMRSVSYRGLYMGFFNNTGAAGVSNDGFLFNHVSPNGLVGLFGGVHCAYADRESGNLYYVASDDGGNNYIYKWDDQVDRVAFLWKSKLFIAQDYTNFGALRIFADWDGALTQAEVDAYNAIRNDIIAANQALLETDDLGTIGGDVIAEIAIAGDGLTEVPPAIADIVGLTFKLFADGTLVCSITVDNEDPVRLPSGYLASEFEFELQGQTEVREVRLATSVPELMYA